jgi:hypothetical protein
VKWIFYANVKTLYSEKHNVIFVFQRLSFGGVLFTYVTNR